MFGINSKEKEKYLDYIKKISKPATIILYEKLIRKLDEFEEYKGISATNMTKNDFLELLTSLNSTSLSVLYTYKSAINGYLISILDPQEFKIGILELEKITKEDLINCLNTRMENLQFITEDEYFDLLEDKVDKNGKVEFTGNYQDKLIVVLLWNKIKGEKNYSEILNLKNEDVNLIDRTITLEDRVVKLSQLEMDIVKKAMVEPYYVRAVRTPNHIISVTNSDYVSGQFLVKATQGRKNLAVENNQCAYGNFANRLNRYFTLVLGRPELTGLKIYKSSIYYYMLLEYKRILEPKEVLEYAEDNNLKISLSNNIREQEIMFKKMKEQGLI